MDEDLKQALDAIEEVMVCDKGQSEEEWVKWCNEILPFMHRHGRMIYTISYH